MPRPRKGRAQAQTIRRKPKLLLNKIINLQVSVPVRTYKYEFELLLLFFQAEYRQTFVARTSKRKAHVVKAWAVRACCYNGHLAVTELEISIERFLAFFRFTTMKKILKDTLLISLIALSTIGLITFAVSLCFFFVGCSQNQSGTMETAPLFMLGGLFSFIQFGVFYCATKAFWLYIEDKEKTTVTQYV